MQDTIGITPLEVQLYQFLQTLANTISSHCFPKFGFFHTENIIQILPQQT